MFNLGQTIDKIENELEDEESSEEEREAAVHDSNFKTHDGEKHERRGSKSNPTAERRRSGNIMCLNATLPGEVALTGLTASEKSQMLKLARKVAKVSVKGQIFEFSATTHNKVVLSRSNQ